ncbi:MAG: hypothetical protein QGH47_06485, partial [Candidatus Woesearchaeota archaeon]|nr:hypothetical protein [Candidatus Woesearchaeota archaeon]
EFTLSNQRTAANTLVSTLLKEGQPFMIDTYVTDASGRTIKMINQYPGKLPHWTYEYEFHDGEVPTTRTNGEGEIYKYKMMVTEKDGNDRISVAVYEELDGGKIIGRIFTKRDENGILIQEIMEDEDEPVKAVISCDTNGRWLLREHFMKKEVIMRQEYSR